MVVQIREYHRNYITALRFDPASHWLAPADSDGKLVPWDTLPLQRIVEWSYSDGFPRAQRFAADGKRLAVTSQGGERLSVFDVDPAWWRRRALALAGTQHEKQ